MRRWALFAGLMFTAATPLGAATAAEKQNLVYVTEAPDAVFFVDAETIRRQGDQATAWVFMVPAKPVTGDGKPVVAGAAHRVHDCKAGAYRDFADTLYTEDGAGPVHPDQEAAQDARPGSVAAAILDYVCFGKKDPDTWQGMASWREAYQAAQAHLQRKGR